MLKKCFMCGKVIFRTHGKIAVQGDDYVIQKPMCKKCTSYVESEYNLQQEIKQEMSYGEK